MHLFLQCMYYFILIHVLTEFNTAFGSCSYFNLPSVAKHICKDYLQSYHTHISVSFFETKKRQRALTVCMAAGGIKGLIYLEARACFSVHSGIHILLFLRIQLFWTTG